jgi:hypothetical protein
MKENQRVILNQNGRIGDLIFKENLNDNYNPIGVFGTVIKVGNTKMASNPIIVMWDNGFKNSYEKVHLIKLD